METKTKDAHTIPSVVICNVCLISFSHSTLSLLILFFYMLKINNYVITTSLLHHIMHACFYLARQYHLQIPSHFSN